MSRRSSGVMTRRQSFLASRQPAVRTPRGDQSGPRGQPAQISRGEDTVAEQPSTPTRDAEMEALLQIEDVAAPTPFSNLGATSRMHLVTPCMPHATSSAQGGSTQTGKNGGRKRKSMSSTSVGGGAKRRRRTKTIDLDTLLSPPPPPQQTETEQQEKWSEEEHLDNSNNNDDVDSNETATTSKNKTHWARRTRPIPMLASVVPLISADSSRTPRTPTQADLDMLLDMDDLGKDNQPVMSTPIASNAINSADRGFDLDLTPVSGESARYRQLQNQSKLPLQEEDAFATTLRKALETKLTEAMVTIDGGEIILKGTGPQTGESSTRSKSRRLSLASARRRKSLAAMAEKLAAIEAEKKNLPIDNVLMDVQDHDEDKNPSCADDNGDIHPQHITNASEEIDSILQQAQKKAEEGLKEKNLQSKKKVGRVHRARNTTTTSEDDRADTRFGVPSQCTQAKVQPQREKKMKQSLKTKKVLPTNPRAPLSARSSSSSNNNNKTIRSTSLKEKLSTATSGTKTPVKSNRSNSVNVKTPTSARRRNDENATPNSRVSNAQRQVLAMTRLATPKRVNSKHSDASLDDKKHSSTRATVERRETKITSQSRIPKPTPGNSETTQRALLNKSKHTAIPLPKDSSLRNIFVTPKRKGLKESAVVQRSSALERARQRYLERKAAENGTTK